MLSKAFNLYVLDMIFKNCPFKVSYEAKGLYASILNEHFKKKELDLLELKAFYVPYGAEILLQNKQWRELNDAELVVIDTETTFVPDSWSNFIDRSIFPDQNKAMTYIGSIAKTTDEIKDLLRDNQHLFEVCAMKYSLTLERFHQLVALFVLEQLAFGKKYQSEADMTKHFAYWIPHHLNQKPVVHNSPKSSPKILGE